MARPHGHESPERQDRHQTQGRKEHGSRKSADRDVSRVDSGMVGVAAAHLAPIDTADMRKLHAAENDRTGA